MDIGQTDGAKLPTNTYLEIRYEDILVAPETTMRKVFAFLDEEYEDSVVHFRKARGGGKTPLLRQPLQGDNSNKWRGQMTPRQIRIFEGVAASTLARNGYPVVTPAGPLPLFARAFRGVYPPASTFKVSVALAALEAEVVDRRTTFDCPGRLKVGNRYFHNWNRSGEGRMGVVGALMRSRLT